MYDPILLTNVFTTDLRWSNSIILISINDTLVFSFCYWWIVLNVILLRPTELLPWVWDEFQKTFQDWLKSSTTKSKQQSKPWTTHF